ncbi:MAG TPA: aspartate--ammonia ligase [Candidatus Borkfalkia faecavium]|uniref:Aspartate--ammonia ligase n=1 Tax=Candidatus Borkfalkia faecavium TaxID=2838508 RepID=A0A9D1W295_9FIRM|nr:aspartate--ammonia ligase [Candidatus Borkfalkia faecavium]
MYTPKLTLIQTERALKEIKTIFEKELSEALNLTRISAPLFVSRESGLNDDLNGVERPVSFDVKATGEVAEVVHSLAKWKRYALAKYRFGVRFGLYTDMNAIRRDEDLDNLHSVYVDQWDWEAVIRRDDRTIEFLQATVKKIYAALQATAHAICTEYPALDNYLSDEIGFVTTQQLEDMYPDLTPKQRETAYVREHGSTFVMQIGGKLRSGKKHDGRAPDYDDWSLNGDIILYYPVLDCAFEVSSMGIRVDEKSLVSQLKEENCLGRLEYPFHKALEAGELPLTMGGGIGQSRLCMFLLNKMHIGEVQVSLWDEKTQKYCEENNIPLM